MPLRHDEWHFYENSQNRTGLNEDKNMHIREKTEGVNKIVLGLFYEQMSQMSNDSQKFETITRQLKHLN